MLLFKVHVPVSQLLPSLTLVLQCHTYRCLTVTHVITRSYLSVDIVKSCIIIIFSVCTKFYYYKFNYYNYIQSPLTCPWQMEFYNNNNLFGFFFVCVFLLFGPFFVCVFPFLDLLLLLSIILIAVFCVCVCVCVSVSVCL